MPSLTQLSLQANSFETEGRITTLGHVFKQGDIASGAVLQARIDEAVLPLQVDIKSTWPDGSLKHAVLSFSNPAGLATATIDLLISETQTPGDPAVDPIDDPVTDPIDTAADPATDNGTPAQDATTHPATDSSAPSTDAPTDTDTEATPPDTPTDPAIDTDTPGEPAVIDVAAAALAQGYAFEVEIDGEIVDVAALLAGAGGSDWLSGALVSETRVAATLANGLEVRVDVRAGADGVIDTSVVVGNDNILTTGLEAKTYAVAVRQNGETLYENAALTQPHFTVWREQFSTETAANTAHVVYDLDYLRGTGLLPSVDDTLPLTDSLEYYDRLTDPGATFDPLELGGIDNRGGIDGDRGRTGDTPSYGLLTDDQHSYLVTQSAEAREAMLALTDQYGAFSNYYQNPETGEAYFLEDTAFNSFRTGTGKDLPGTDGIIDLTNDGEANRNKTSHKPSEYYLSYLVSGDRYYADGLAHEAGSAHLLWENATYLTERGAVNFGAQLREQTWMLRDLFYGASLAPDGTHAAEVLNARLDGALQDYVDYYVNDLALENQLGRTLSGARVAPRFTDGELEGVLQSYNGSALDRPYWQDWFATVIGQIAATGNENALTLGRWMAGFSAERFLQDDFDPLHNFYSLTNYPGDRGSRDLDSDITWAELNTAAQGLDGIGPDVNPWADETFYAAAAWGGAAAAFSGVRDARYAEALLWMSSQLTDEYIALQLLQGSAPQMAVPVTFADKTIAGVLDRTIGTAEGEAITDEHGNRIIHAGDGDDTVVTGGGSHLVEGGEGNDRLRGGAGEDWLFGGSGADTLSGGAGINYLQGDRFDRDFVRSADRFLFTDTPGETTIGDFDVAQDSLVFESFEDITTAAQALNGFLDSDGGATLVSGAHKLVLSGLTVADLTLEGSAPSIIISQNKTLSGGNGNDTISADIADENPLLLRGFGGDDTLNGSDGGERLSGGSGNDTLNGDGGNDMLFGGSGDDMLHAGDGDDRVFGGGGADQIEGGSGQDTINANSGNDTVYGGADADLIRGGYNDDILYGEAGSDGIFGQSGNDTLYGGSEDDTLNGGSEDDMLFGEAGADHLAGASGNDMLTGGEGDDTLRGGAGDDTLLGGDGDDSLQGSRGADLLEGGEGNDRLRGSLDGDILRGGAGDDRLSGDADADTLDGGDGNDMLLGGDGDDHLSGGEGIDLFVFRNGWGADTVSDFANDGSEKLNLRAISDLSEFTQLTITDGAEGALVSFAGNSILLEGLSAADLDTSDFIL